MQLPSETNRWAKCFHIFCILFQKEHAEAELRDLRIEFTNHLDDYKSKLERLNAELATCKEALERKRQVRLAFKTFKRDEQVLAMVLMPGALGHQALHCTNCTKCTRHLVQNVHFVQNVNQASRSLVLAV